MMIKTVFSALYRSYIVKSLAKDVTKFVKNNFDDIEWDKEYWLHKAGLTTYSPAKSTFGGLSLFLLGIAAGGVAALAFAPKPGDEFISDVKDKAKDLMGRAQMAADRIQNEVPARV
ncbi:MAG TPA: YtxH domain-containing protein [Myxococcaceae bacterium]|jgi:hypothetical protein|nr:YtxH domain-containing protein [Myxococcaceae bacterium]